MLYEYEGKVYVKPFPNKIVEVDIKKDKNDSYNVIATNKVVEDDKVIDKINSISLEEAYKISNKRNRTLE